MKDEFRFYSVYLKRMAAVSELKKELDKLKQGKLEKVEK